ncbi:hypothetical protein PR048_015569 [Dryococelus australis]|uniref:Uncharacterized protein n=1 Tax=Dryococelus australis TaxID=614101 RepID=A0ABQ9HHG6_9NEOP|nr:hypothetical protein PR048_015569 [Dryococelus australis]
MVACDFQPFNLVEDKVFRAFVKSLDPKYELPSKTTLRNKLLPQIYEECKTKLLIMLEKASYVSVTCDLWSSREGNSFLTATCNFADGDFKITNVVLSTNTMTSSHTAENIAAKVSKISKDWTLEKKVCCIVTDNAASR